MDIAAFATLMGLIFLLAGTVKGAVGIGLPTAAIGMSAMLVDARTAVALTVFPMVTANAWQVYRQGKIGPALRRYAPFASVLALGVGTVLAVTGDAPERLLLGVLGATILVFVAMNAVDIAPRIPARHDRAAQLISGSAAGVLGGLVGVWAPPMVMYLTARDTPKEELIRATGLLILIGSVPLTLGYLAHGFLRGQTGILSLALILPTFLGFALGERLRRHLPETRFRQVLLGIFFLMGLNLIRRALGWS